MDSSIIDTITSLVKGISTLLNAGPVGWGIFGGAVILALIAFFIFKKQIMDFLRNLAAKASDDAGNEARQDAPGKSEEDEKKLRELQEKLDSLEKTQKRAMLDALELSELRDYAIQAYGQETIDEIYSKYTHELEIRYEIYLLYGVKIAQ